MRRRHRVLASPRARIHAMHIPRATTLGSAIVLAMATVACHDTSATTDTNPVGYCAAVRPVAVAIAVRDSLSNRAIATRASGTAVNAAPTVALEVIDTLTLWGGTTLGTYTITVQKPGYRTWTRAAIPVTQTGSCGNPVTVNIAARLAPLP